MEDMVMEVRGQRFPITLSVNRDGTSAEFQTEISGRRFYSETWDGLRTKLMNETRRAAKKISVRFVNQGTLRSGTVYGIHAGTGNFLVEWSDGEKEQITDRFRGVLQPMTTTEKEEGRALAKAQQEAHVAHQAWLKAHSLNLSQAVEAALKED